ncbi:WD40 repeat-containing protein [Trypanosoma rangeli]|uniref:WD40 repeat-containing protein n=1 Tax=Trypanosoma rangeli TaxID=5698 RepID=A0A422N846_TRYRA|nr:WD40 repeat-containing protein [Trypanosoma rangeli]RNF01616.1 WD40 repeat-containing protein [Trypanosoma rangeli]|eukprot:RNF01616.1 WD40 repeat-containing protein [Trypanosoma rangeli]
MLFVASEGKSRLIDLETKAVQRTCTTSHIERRGLTYCASLRAVIAHQSRGCSSFFSPNTQQPLQRSFTLESIVSSACTVDGVFLIGGTAGGNLYVWNTLTGQLHHLVRAHTRRITDITISSDQSLLVTASEDSVCKTWTLAGLVSRGVRTITPCALFNGHTLAVNTCSFMESGFMVVTGSADRTCRIFHALTGRQQLVITLDDAPTAVRSSPDDEMILIGSANGSLFFVNLYENASQQSLPINLHSREERVTERKVFQDGHGGAILFIWFDAARPGYAVVGSENGTVLWWNISTKAAHSEAFPRFSGGVLSICYVPRESLTTPPWPCVGLMKHPLDPSSTDYIVLSAPTEHAAVEKPCVTPPQRRCRESDANAEDGGEETNVKMEETSDSQCRLNAIRRRREKNDELQTLRDRLKAKLQMLTASQGSAR